MIFSIDQKVFYKAINNVQRAVSQKNSLPVLTGILIETDNKGLSLTGTDLDLGIKCWTEANIKKEGKIVLPANHLKNIIRELPSAKINIEYDNDKENINIKCLNSLFEINGYNPEEYPQLPEVDNPTKILISSLKLKKIIEEVKFSVSNNQSQPGLTGALMVLNEKTLTMVATNTYRLAYSKKKIGEEKEKIENLNEINKFIIPGNTLNELNNLLSETDDQLIEIFIDSNHCCFTFDKITVISRLIEGQFPNYQQVIPEKYNSRITVEKDEFKNAVKRVSLISRLNSNEITLKSDNNKLIIHSEETETGIAHEEISIKKEGPAQNIKIDADYLLDLLKIIDEENINIDLIDPLSPLTIRKKDSNYIYLIMPIRPEE